MTKLHPDGTPYPVEGPQPLVRPVPPGANYPAGALGPLQEVVEAVQGLTQAPAAIPAQSALAVSSLAVQAFANVETLGGDAPLSLLALTSAQSGERKSTCDKLIMQGLRKFEKEQEDAYRKERAAYQDRHGRWKARHETILREVGRAKGEKKIAAEADLEALGPEPIAPPLPSRTVTEPTFEGLAKLYYEGQPSLGLFSDEGGQFIGGHAMNPDNRLKSVAAFNKLWHGDPIQRTRAGDGSYTLHGRRLAGHILAQPEAVQSLLNDPIARETGFLARFLVTQPTSTIGTRLSSKMRQDYGALDRFEARLLRILRTPMPMNPDTRELTPRRLALRSDARVLLVAYADWIELEQRPEGRFAHVTAYASKSAEQAARIAGVLTLVEDLEAQEVSAEAMKKGLDLALYYLEEAVRLADAAAVSEETAQAEALRTWLLERWPDLALSKKRSPDKVTPRDVVQWGPGVLRETIKVKKAFAILEEFGWVGGFPAGEIIDSKARKLAYLITRDRDAGADE